MTKKILKISVFLVFFILLMGYAFFISKNLILGVKIKNVKIERSNQSEIIRISGNAKNAKNLILNGREILIDPQGNFNDRIALLKGYNIIEIQAKDKFENVDKKNYKLMGK